MPHAVCMPLCMGKLGLVACHMQGQHCIGKVSAGFPPSLHAPCDGYSQLCPTLFAINPDQGKLALAHAAHMQPCGGFESAASYPRQHGSCNAQQQCSHLHKVVSLLCSARAGMQTHIYIKDIRLNHSTIYKNKMTHTDDELWLILCLTLNWINRYNANSEGFWYFRD